MVIEPISVTALKFLLCDAADKRLPAYRPADDAADAGSIATKGSGLSPRRNVCRFDILVCWGEGRISLWHPGSRWCVPLVATGQNHRAEANSRLATTRPRNASLNIVASVVRPSLAPHTVGMTDTLILDAIDAFLARDVAPYVHALEHDDIYPEAIVARMRELGLFGATIARPMAGLGCPVRPMPISSSASHVCGCH